MKISRTAKESLFWGSILILLLILGSCIGANLTPASAQEIHGDALPKLSAAEKSEAARKMLADYPEAVGAYTTRIGNSSAGNTLTTPVLGEHKRFPDGAPVSLAIPQNAEKVGLEWSPDEKTVYLRILSGWNEGGYHSTYVNLDTLQTVGGAWDLTWPLFDEAQRTEANKWRYGAGWWLLYPEWQRQIVGGYPEKIRFVELKRGPDSGYPGFSWDYTPGGLVIRTPRGVLYGLCSMETVVTDPANSTLLFSRMNSHTVNWSSKGNGREQRTFTPSYDFDKHPTDPRRQPKDHPAPTQAVRVGGDLYLFSGSGNVMLHKWSAAEKVLVPVAIVHFSPGNVPDNIPAPPAFTWGQGVINRADTSGNFASDRWEPFNASKPHPLWNGFTVDVSPEGDLYVLPRWQGANDTYNVAKWKTFDLVRGVWSPDNITELALPDALKTSHQLEQVRIDWKSGDLVACVQRGRYWNLERYPGWMSSPNKAAIKPAYSTGPIAHSVRRNYASMASYSPEWKSSPSAEGDIPQAGFGTMTIIGAYVVVAEMQAGAIRVYRLSDGAIRRRASNEESPNSTIDEPTQIQGEETPTELRVFIQDFHYKAARVWRIPKKSL